jgi:hypothetical protein
MKNTTTLCAGLCLSTILFTGQAGAVMDHPASSSPILYERVATVQNSDQHLAQITIDQDAHFTLTLTDFAFPDELDQLGVTLISATGELDSIVLESDQESAPGYSAFGSQRNPVFGSAVTRRNHSWGADFKQESVTGFIEAGSYYISMYADFDSAWYSGLGGQNGLYGVRMEVSAVPLPASAVFLVSGLGVVGYMRRRGQKEINRLLAA